MFTMEDCVFELVYQPVVLGAFSCLLKVHVVIVVSELRPGLFSIVGRHALLDALDRGVVL